MDRVVGAAGRFGRERYYEFYASRAGSLDERMEAAFGKTVEAVQREWHAHVRECAPARPTHELQMRRRQAVLCDRVHWLHESGLRA